MLFQFIAGLLDENWTLGIETFGIKLPDENIAGLLELKVAGRKTLPDFGIKPDEKYDQIFGIESCFFSKRVQGIGKFDWNLEFFRRFWIIDFDGDIGIQLCYGVFKQENLKVLKISLDTTDSLLSLDIDFDSFSTLWTWKFDGLFLSSLDVKFDDFSALWIWHSGKFCNGSIRFLSVRMGRVHMEYFDEDFLRVRMERVRMGYFNRDFFCEIF
ncbi:hypothetical protein RhiirA5_410380 [Rhizophagus irregularis]|uniref:Uncharacterized protein n=1 Tax=Rhizophagus irregularis TaxID=588596 RepID=A0A2N0Q3K4_9GLOM|nr:hypothetical protein RhiirA5_410380 [Rhizophagus irregularis]